jgi:hypothetical protein
LLILVIPNVCPYISAQLYRIPSIRENEKRKDEIHRHSHEVARKHINETVKEFKLKYGGLFSEFESMKFGGVHLFSEAKPEHRKAAQQRAEVDPEFKAMMDAFAEEGEKARQELLSIREESKMLDKDLERKAAVQTKLAKNLACISPFANFVYVARDLTGTGLRSLDYFVQTKDEYEQQFGSYADKKIDDAREKNPALDKESFLDVSDRPRFAFKEEALNDKVNEVLPYWGILVMFNVVFFAGAFAGFMIYDVR